MPPPPAPSRCLVAACGHPSSFASGSLVGSWASQAGPCPPAWHHPPLVSRRTGWVLAATFAVYMALSTLLQLACEAAGWSDGESGGVWSLYLHLSLLCSVGWVLVSLHMRRPLLHALGGCSRYGGSGEWRKMHLVLPWVLLTGLLFTLRVPTPSEKDSGVFLSSYTLLFPPSSASASASSATGNTGLVLVSHLPLPFVLAFFLGVHFTFLDGSTTLQSLGCKLPLPSLWPELTRRELLVTAGATLGIVVSLVPTIVFLLRGDEDTGTILASLLTLALVVIYLADMHHTGSGTLGSGASSGGGNGLEAPMSGRDMWRTKIAQIIQAASATATATTTSSASPPPSAAVAAADLAVSSASEIRPLVPGSASRPSPCPSLSASASASTSTPAPQIFVHVHHYLWGLFLLPLLRFPSLSSIVASGLCLGLAVEGIACWVMDPILVCKRPIEPQRSAAVAATAAITSTSTAAAATATTAATVVAKKSAAAVAIAADATSAVARSLPSESQLPPSRLLQ